MLVMRSFQRKSRRGSGRLVRLIWGLDHLEEVLVGEMMIALAAGIKGAAQEICPRTLRTHYNLHVLRPKLGVTLFWEEMTPRLTREKT